MSSNVETAQPNEPREAKGGKGKKDTSRDMLSAVEARVGKMAVSMTKIKEQADETEGRLNKLEDMNEELADQLQGALNESVDRLTTRNDALEAMVEALRAELVELKEQLETCKTAMVGGVLTVQTARPKVPEPKEFKGTRSAKDVDNFIWGMEQYLRAMGITDDALKVSTASMYLTDIALLWWRRRSTDGGRGGDTIETWDQFKGEFKQQFYPEYAENEARAKLRRLTQRGTVREYVREFSELMLQISDLGDKEAFFAFMDGLKPWAQQELQRRGVQDLTKAMSAAESLVEFKKPEKNDSSKNKTKGNGGKDRDNGRAKGDGKPHSGKWKSHKEGDTKEDRKPLECFLCQGPHMARNCPRKAKLASCSKDEEESGRESLKLGSIMLGAIQPKRFSRKKGLMFVDIVVAGHKLKALVDTGASNLFASEEIATKLGLEVKKGNGWIKTVNSKEVPTMGVAQGVGIQLGQWSGKEPVEVIPLDDYDFVVGLSFLDRINALVVPFANCICILDP